MHHPLKLFVPCNLSLTCIIDNTGVRFSHMVVDGRSKHTRITSQESYFELEKQHCINFLANA